MLTVMKFGGSSVADLEHIRNVAKRCIEKQQAGSQVVVATSAMGKTTDNLIATAKQITERAVQKGIGHAAFNRRTSICIVDGHDADPDGSQRSIVKCMAGANADNVNLSECTI